MFSTFGSSSICYNSGKYWPAHMLYYCKVPHSTSANTHRKTKWSATAICLSFSGVHLSEWVEHIMLSNQYTTCSTTVWFILKQTHEEMRVPSCGGRHELWWTVVLGNHTSSTAHWDAPCSYDYEWRITEREHKFNTGAPLQHSKVINPPAKKFRLGSNQSK